MIIKQADLTNVISEIIEGLAMMVVEPPETPETTEDFRPELYGSIEFTGPVCGKFAIRCREALAQILAANLLGTENSDVQSQTQAWDALAELLNVICGNLVTALIDSKSAFTLSIPQINIISPSQKNDTNIDIGNSGSFSEIEERQTALLLLDGQPAEFTLLIGK